MAKNDRPEATVALSPLLTSAAMEALTCNHRELTLPPTSTMAYGRGVRISKARHNGDEG